MTKLSLIVPCYNEEQNVEAFYARCQEVFPTDQYEVVFVNDGSKDGTYKKLQKLHEEHDNILVVNFSRNFEKNLPFMQVCIMPVEVTFLSLMPIYSRIRRLSEIW